MKFLIIAIGYDYRQSKIAINASSTISLLSGTGWILKSYVPSIFPLLSFPTSSYGVRASSILKSIAKGVKLPMLVSFKKFNYFNYSQKNIPNSVYFAVNLTSGFDKLSRSRYKISFYIIV